MKSNAPIVAIVGRANVGKSSLFNALIGRREAIVASEPGTTRDSVSAKASVDGKDFWLVDTAGMKAPEDEFELTIQEQITEATRSADIILVVTQADVPVTDEDRRVAKLALKSRKPVILAVNKADKIAKTTTEDWLKLGVKSVVLTSATQKIGIDDLAKILSRHLTPARISETPERLRLAILGRPNVGKSTLFNALARKQQAIVSEKAGTTRDVNRIRITYHQKQIELLDTAGIRRNGKIERGAEKFSVLRALAAIEESDVCLVLMDSGELNVGLDQKIAGLVKAAGKGLILIVSKWDKLEVNGSGREQIAGQIVQNFAFAPWAPLVFTSGLTGQNITKIFELALAISKERQNRPKTSELNRWLERVTSRHPPAGLRNSFPKLNYMVQEDGTALPSFRIYGSHVKSLHWSYKRYLDRRFRESWPFSGTPIKFWFIDKRSP